MRILMLAQFYPPTIGGEERYVQDLSRALVSRGHHVAVATLWHTGLPAFEVDQGVRVYRIRGTSQRFARLFSEANRRHAPPVTDPELVLHLRKIILRERPAIVHAHNWLVHSFLPLKRWSRAKLVMSLHDYSLVCAKKSLLRGNAACAGPGIVKCLLCASQHYGALKGVPTVISNWVMSANERAQVDLFIAVSEAVAQQTGIASSSRPAMVIPNFVPDCLEANDDAVRELLPAQPFMLYVGDLRKFKGIQVMLDAYAGLAGAPPLVLIGRKDADTPTQFPANVIVREPLPHPAVISAWRSSLFGLMPSIGPETFGIAALEAMILGRPVIASRIGGLPDLVRDGETGLLVPPGNVPALRQAMTRLLDDSALCAQLGQVAQQRALQFRASAIVPRIENAYIEVIHYEK